MYAEGNAYDAQNDYGLAAAEGPRRPVPGWKFGVSPQSRNEDRGSI